MPPYNNMAYWVVNCILKVAWYINPNIRINLYSRILSKINKCHHVTVWLTRHGLKDHTIAFQAFKEFYSLFQAKYLKQISLDYQAQGSYCLNVIFLNDNMQCTLRFWSLWWSWASKSLFMTTLALEVHPKYVRWNNPQLNCLQTWFSFDLERNLWHPG